MNDFPRLVKAVESTQWPVVVEDSSCKATFYVLICLRKIGANTRETLDQVRATREEALVSRVRSGNADAFYLLIEPYLASVRRLVRSLVRNPADAEDIVQDAILFAFTRLHQLRSSARFHGWFTQIAVNTAKMKMRRERSRPFTESLDSAHANDHAIPVRDRLVSHSDPPSRTVETEELRKVLLDALKSLPLHYRRVILLRDFRELSGQETAAVLGLPPTLTKLHLHRARQKLRTKLIPSWRRAARN